MCRAIGFRVFATVALASLAMTARADEDWLPLEEVPKAVMKSVRGRFPEARLKQASKETDDGRVHYEIRLRHGGHDYDVTLKDSGAFVEIEESLSPAELPESVTDAITARYANAQIGRAERITRGERTHFEIHLRDGNASHELDLDRDGMILEDDLEDQD